jgi:hypothetical protein
MEARSHLEGIERRSSPRRSLIAEIECRSRGAFSVGRIINVSQGGILMETPEPPEPGTPVEVRFAVQAPQSAGVLESKGIVVRSNAGHGRMAVRFTDLSSPDRETIESYLGS